MSSEKSKEFGEYWTNFKKVLIQVETFCALNDSTTDATKLADFLAFLTKQKSLFVTLLQNPAKNAKQREEIRKELSGTVANNEGGRGGAISSGLSGPALSSNFKQEALLISDMYNLNEQLALDLLMLAECQLQNYPGLTRGLVAVLIYYESRFAAVKSLKLLVQLRRGLWWKVSHYPSDLIEFVDRFLSDLVEKNGLFTQIYQLLNKMDLSAELQLLQENCAIGPAKHCSKLINLFRKTRKNLAEVIFLWAAQTGLTKTQTFQLLEFLQNISIISDKGNEVIDDVNLILQMAYMYAVDLSAFNFHEDTQLITKTLPMFTESNFLVDICARLKTSVSEEDTNSSVSGSSLRSGHFKCKEIEAVTCFVTAICAAAMRNSNRDQVHNSLLMDYEFALVERAVKANIFDVFTLSVFENDFLFEEETFVRRLHFMLTDFIAEMPRTVKQMKVVADKVSETTMIYANEGLQAPSDLSHGLEKLLLMMAAFYTKEANQYSLDLGLDFWKGHSQRHTSLRKFLTTVNEDITPILLVPYLKFLASLSTNSEKVARLSYHYLKQNEFTIYKNKVSFDHFFGSFHQYFCHLRQENVAPRADTVYHQHTHHPKGIQPHEIRGLHAVLELVRSIADADDFARVAIVEHPGWSVTSLFFGLIGCPIPIYLKAEILITLASLAKSTETVVTIWNALESSQILPTISTTSTFQPRGIKTELEEVESSMEKYPLTCAMLTLLNALVSVSSVPRNLGQNVRKPGFEPYFNFVLDSVLMKFHSRPYKDANEKWQVAEHCLKLFNRLLQHYSPEASDFLHCQQVVGYSYPPGFHIMMHLCNNTELFTLISFIIDSGAELLNTYNYTTGTSWVEKCTLEALQLLENALKLEPLFFDAIKNSSVSSIVLTHVHQLLYSVNPRSGKADYLLRIAHYLSYQSWLTAHALSVVDILSEALKYPFTNKHLMKLIVYDTKLDREFRHAFVECLDLTEDDCETSTAVSAAPTVANAALVPVLKIAILKLLRLAFDHAAPNLTHYLLGFDVRKDIVKTVFEQAGFNNQPRTCLHAIFDLIQLSSFEREPELGEQLFHVSYMICANPITCDSMLRFLRSQNDFFANNLQVPKVTDDEHVFNMNALLMKIVAIEIRICAKKKQITNFNKIAGQLLDNVLLTDGKNRNQIDFRNRIDSRELFLLKTFTNFEMTKVNFDVPKWNYFDRTLMKNLLKNCTVTSNRLSAINLKKLHESLMQELGSVQSSLATGDRQLILTEIHSLLDYATLWNKQQRYLAAIVEWIDGWRQMVIVFFANYQEQSNLLTLEERQMIILRLIETIFDRIRTIDYFKSNKLIEMFLSQLICLLLDQLEKLSVYEQGVQQLRKDAAGAGDGSDANISSSGDSTTAFVPSTVCKHVMVVRRILVESVEWLIENDLSNLELKTNLYMALFRILKIFENISKFAVNRNMFFSNSAGEDRQFSSVFNVGRSLELAADVLSNYGDRLINLICDDCISGNGNPAMLSMGLLQQFISLNMESKWVPIAYTKGYLKFLIESLFESDKTLKSATMDDIKPETLRLFYFYETKMALFSQMARAEVIGTETLLELKLLSYLSSMTVFDNHPEVLSYENNSYQTDMNSMIPTVTTRFHQILIPALDFCNAALLGIGKVENRAVINQILFFMLSHFESFQVILRSAQPKMLAGFMKELALVTGILAHTASAEAYATSSQLTVDTPLSSNRANLIAYKKHMFHLLHRFVLNRQLIKSLRASKSSTATVAALSATAAATSTATIASGTFTAAGALPKDFDDPDIEKDRFIYCLQTINHIFIFISEIMNQKDMYQTSTTILFKPIIYDETTDRNILENEPDIGVVIRHLTVIVQYYQEAKSFYDLLKNREKSISTMSTADLKTIIEDFDFVSNTEAARMYAYKIISKQIERTNTELSLCLLIVSNSVYILWSHLNYYMNKAVPQVVENLTSQASSMIKSSTELNWQITVEQVALLKKQLVKIFNDTFCKQLLDVSKDCRLNEYDVISALVRRIKRLIQFVPVK